MIKLEHVVLPSPEQMEFVIEGMRNPMNSWDKSDSLFNLEYSSDCGGNEHLGGTSINGLGYWAPNEASISNKYYIGTNDLNLMSRLAAAGTDHRKFMRMMPVMVRITAPLYWWSEFDTYKVGTVANSCSKMHKLLEKPFTMNDFSFDKLPGYKNEPSQFRPEIDEDLEEWLPLKEKFSLEEREIIKQRWNNGEFESRREMARIYGVSHTCINDILNDKYHYIKHENIFENFARPVIDTLNELRDSYLECEEDSDRKNIWYSIIQLLPESYNQTRNVMLNYEVLVNMYHSRKTHKLDEWVEFCKWVETLPYAELIIGE